MKTLIVAAALLATALTQAAPSVTVVATFRVDDARTTALAINALGQVAGFRAYTGKTADRRPRTYEGFAAFLTAPDGAAPAVVAPITGTGLVASGPCKGLVFTSAFTALNASGAAAGESTVSVTTGTKTAYPSHAVLYAGGTLTDLGALGGAGAWSTATGINASGAIVGTSQLDRTKVHAFLSDGTTMTDLGTLGGGYSAATAINDGGTVVGGSNLLRGAVHPFSCSGGTMTDLGLPEGFGNASASAISSNGIVAGWGIAGHTVASFVLQGGTFTNLGSLYTTGGRKPQPTPMQATGVNADGTVVGNTLDAKGKPRAFVSVDGTLTDLNASLPSDYATWTVVSATGITDAGYISAIGVDASKKQVVLLLKLS